MYDKYGKIEFKLGPTSDPFPRVRNQIGSDLRPFSRGTKSNWVRPLALFQGKSKLHVVSPPTVTLLHPQVKLQKNVQH